MRFSVFALSTVPDTATTRQLFDLDDLDDKSVSKVMFHRRKQQTGSSEKLRWDQRAIASLTLIHHNLDGVKMESLTLADHSEGDMLHAFYRTASQGTRLVSWDGDQTLIPLIHFRSLKHLISYPIYWEACRSGAKIHLDLRSWLSPTTEDRPNIHETARKLGLPGMLGLSDEKVTDDWLKGDIDGVRAFSEILALNAYLLAMRLFSTTGELPRHDSERVTMTLREGLSKRRQSHIDDFLAAWGNA